MFLKDLRDWMESGGDDGVIYFSMGSNINSANLPAAKLSAILTVFGELRQKVLWKWEADSLPGQPDNVKIAKWLPQDDILSYSSIRAFISHCGKSSVIEAKYHGVPILGIPIYGDQFVNLRSIVEEGWAVAVDYQDLDVVNFRRAVHEILDNVTYGQVARAAADLFKDRPQHPLDTAVFWVEYVLRTNGAKHMRSQAVHLNWFESNSLDVLAIFAILIYFTSLLTKCILLKALNKVLRRK